MLFGTSCYGEWRLNEATGKEPRDEDNPPGACCHNDRFVEIRKSMSPNGNFPGSALITVSAFARPGIELDAERLPRRLLDRAVHLAQPGRRHPQRGDLADAT